MNHHIKMMKDLGITPKPIERGELLERMELKPRQLAQLQRYGIISVPTYETKSQVFIYPPETMLRVYTYRTMRKLDIPLKYIRRYLEDGNFLFLEEE